MLAIGPLTNLALAMTIDPNCAKKWRSLTIMGGTSWGRGNVTAAAEFNFFHDPEAAAAVFAKKPEELDTKIVTWEATREGTFKKEMINFHPHLATFKVLSLIFTFEIFNLILGKMALGALQTNGSSNR